MFLRIFKHLLPNALAWNLTADKQLRDFFNGLTGMGEDIKEYFDLIWLDILPQETRQLDEWDDNWGLINSGLTDQQRRDRLDASWAALGGQTLAYIQATIRANGFDVYLHEWWVPGSGFPVPTVRNPFDWLRSSSNNVVFLAACGEDLAECGEAIAVCGGGTEPLGYPLVNKIFITQKDYIAVCGADTAACGEADALCGNYLNFLFIQRDYSIPGDPATWPYFLYIGGETFGDLATVDPKRKNEFENLCLKLCPTQQWLGIMVSYN